MRLLLHLPKIIITIISRATDNKIYSESSAVVNIHHRITYNNWLLLLGYVGTNLFIAGNEEGAR